MKCVKCTIDMGLVPKWKKLCLKCWKAEKFGTKNETDIGLEQEARFLDTMEESISLAENSFERDSDFRKKTGLYKDVDVDYNYESIGDYRRKYGNPYDGINEEE